MVQDHFVRLLLTGSSGFVGRAILPSLESTFEVRPFDVRDGDDVLDHRAVTAAARGVDAIVHLALSYGRGRAAFFEENLDGTRNVLDAANEAGVARVVLMSSVRALGRWGDGTTPPYLPIDDAMEPVPVDDYSVVKLAMERLAARRSQQTDLVTICLRPPAVYDEAGVSAAEERRKTKDDDEWNPRWEYGSWIHAQDLGRAVVASIMCTPPPGRHGIATVVADDINTRRFTSLELVRRLHGSVEWRGGDEYHREPYLALVRVQSARSMLSWEPQKMWGAT